MGWNYSSIKFVNRKVISSHILQGLWLLIHAGSKVKLCKWKSCTTYLFILLFSLSSRCKLDKLVNCRLWTMNNPFPVKHTFNWPMLTPPPALGFWLTGMCWWSYSCSVTDSEIGIGCNNHRSFNRNTYRKKTYVILVSFIILLKILSGYNDVIDSWQR